jgi:uncharacterized protein YbbK (DUF523 family)/uncharacterized protein YbgA (DUF1722 family)
MTSRPDWLQPPGPIRIGVSSCLLGEAVRHDGRHKRDAYVADTLGADFELVPVCPEVALGLGVPREPIRLVQRARGAITAVGVRDPALQPGAALRAYGRRMAAELDDLCGHVLKSRSPSCGMAGVPVYLAQGGAGARRGVGLYAAELMAARPELPVEDERRLADPARREHFLERVLALARWRALCAGGLSAARLAAFHEAHRLQLAAHGAGHGAVPARRLARLIAAGDDGYGAAFMAVLRRPGTRRGHARVLEQLCALLREMLTDAQSTRLAEAIADYRAGAAPLGAPLALLRERLRRRPHPALLGQTYLAARPGVQRGAGSRGAARL